MSLELKEILVVVGCVIAAALAIIVWFRLTPTTLNDNPAGETNVQGVNGDSGISH